MVTTLPTDSDERKDYALFSGCLRYFPAALAGVGKTSKLGNDKHNPGQEMHHARSKSGDHGDCILRHLVDLEDLVAAMNRGEAVTKEHILNEVNSMVWRSLALSQELHEKLGAPLAPGAKLGTEKPQPVAQVEKEIKFPRGEIVQHINNDAEVVVEATFFDAKGSPVLFVKDPADNNKIYAVDPSFYKSIYKEAQ
jgi:hypothetical protein